MLLDLEFGKTRDHRENVTSIIENLADRKVMCTPHDDDEKWADTFRDTVFVDDVTGGSELDKHLVIEAIPEMEFFKKMAVHRKVPKSKVKKQGGNIISTRWIDTDKGHRVNANYRSRLVAREIKKDKRQDLFSATPPPETLKLLVADCAKGQRQAKLFRIGIFNVSRAYLYAPVTRPHSSNTRLKTGKMGMKAQLVSDRSAFMVRGRLRRSGRPHKPSSWSRSGCRGAERPIATSCIRKGTTKMTVHGVDFLAVADLDQIKWIEEQLKSEYAIKAEVLDQSRS